MRLRGLEIRVLEQVGRDDVLADALCGLLAQATQLLADRLVQLPTGDAVGDTRLERSICACFLTGTRVATLLTRGATCPRVVVLARRARAGSAGALVAITTAVTPRAAGTVVPASTLIGLAVIPRLLIATRVVPGLVIPAGVIARLLITA
ncbi:hypothetical protein ACTXKL_01915 [Brachybacterium tyrofermentans]|uniref:hypothetical protein n=1 Tax=Brachybacterium tyrofermentans TaxID=47848 RepID=UPI003FD4BB3F